MIRAGHKTEITRDSGLWVILDIGFAKKAASCGLMIGESTPKQFRFNDAVEQICNCATVSTAPVNLLIEAPLSVAFDKHGNPTGRAIEKRGSSTRYWYVSLGCTVLVASLYLMRSLCQVRFRNEVRLFEGFVSFKNPNEKSDHIKDVTLLREVVDHPTRFSRAIIGSDDLKMEESDKLQSAFLVDGMDFGIPPVIMRSE